jgi:hypothetical protein
MTLKARNFACELGGLVVVPLEECVQLRIDHAGERIDHGRRHGLPELG